MPTFFRNKLPDLLRRLLGIDRAIAASTVTQLMRFGTGPITMLLIIRYLSPAEQGFFYSFAGVMGIQVFLEAGFAQSITQFTSREFAWLRFNKEGHLVGRRASLSRLRSIFHNANKYYLYGAVVLASVLSGGGYLFFSTHEDHGVAWKIPWLVASICAGFNFLLTPIWAVLDGCNRVAEIATYRFWLTLIGFLASTICLPMGLGIHLVTVSSIVTLIFPLAYLGLRWRGLIFQIFRPAGHEQVSWRKEIWGFQWRIAGTWMTRYFLESGIAPLALQLCGVVVAGQIGMTFQIVKLVGGVANTWTVVRIPAWGALAAQGKWSEIEASWRSAAKRSIIICILGLGSFLAGLFVFEHLWPSVADRFLDIPSAAGFVIGWVLYSVWLVSMHYTRALRMEPYTLLHLAVGVAFLIACTGLSGYLGDRTIPWSFGAVHLPAAIAALWILRRVKQKAVCEI